jgi:hypothetical protein
MPPKKRVTKKMEKIDHGDDYIKYTKAQLEKLCEDKGIKCVNSKKILKREMIDLLEKHDKQSSKVDHSKKKSPKVSSKKHSNKKSLKSVKKVSSGEIIKNYRSYAEIKYGFPPIPEGNLLAWICLQLEPTDVDHFNNNFDAESALKNIYYLELFDGTKFAFNPVDFNENIEYRFGDQIGQLQPILDRIVMKDGSMYVAKQSDGEYTDYRLEYVSPLDKSPKIINKKFPFYREVENVNFLEVFFKLYSLKIDKFTL